MKKILIILMLTGLMTACSLTESPTMPVIDTTPPPSIGATSPGDISVVNGSDSTPKSISYTLADVATHSTSSDCWLVLDGGVYDVTSFIPAHPGGEKILKGCGRDATQMFSKHPESAKAMKEQFKIGNLI